MVRKSQSGLANKDNAKKIRAGIPESNSGALHALIFRSLSFVKSFRVISYPRCNSFIYIALLYRLFKLYSTFRYQKLSFSGNFVLSLNLHF